MVTSYFSEWISLSIFPIFNLYTLYLFITTIILVGVIVLKKYKADDEHHPPFIPSKIPFLGHSVEFAKAPVEFLLAAYAQYGPVFSFTMVGKTFTYLIGPEASSLFFNSRNENLNAEEVYSKLTTPVFGKGVAYDVSNEIFLEQKKLFKIGLNIEQFKKHVYLINEETNAYFKKWPSNGQDDILKAFSELIILTASSCLHGKEIRELLDENIAQLYFDLDSGFSHLAWVLPSWVPLPSFKKRDEAHLKMKKIFYNVIKNRRESQMTSDDMLQTLIDAKYKCGRALTDDEVAGLLIGLLLAGQHTSSTTSSWLGFFIAKHKDIQEELYKEQLRVFNDGNGCLSYEGLKECQILDWCLRETLRLRPPIVTMMRMCKTPQKVLNFTIPPGHQVCVSPTTNHILPDSWESPEEFNPYRFENGVSEDKFSYVPFGAGRHRCIGEAFAYVQIKTIWSYLIQNFKFDLIDGNFPKINVTTMIHTPEDPIINFERR